MSPPSTVPPWARTASVRNQRTSEPRADGGLDGLKLAGDLIGLDRLLGEQGAGALLALGDVLPFGVQLVTLQFQTGEGELLLAGLEAGLDHRVHDRFHDLGAVRWDRDGDAEGLADGLVLADQHVEHDAVDQVVRAVVGEHAYDLLRLAVAVHAALALLVAGGVPGQVVVDDGVEVVLEVDALAQAVGGDQDALVGLAQLGDALLALGGRQQAGDRGDLDARGQGACAGARRGTRRWG